jgi:hypothetical protein
MVEKRAHPELVEAFKALKTLPVSVAILDSSGIIVAINDTWKDFRRRNGLRISNAGIGASYLEYCVDSEFATELRALLAGRLNLLTLVYPCHSPSQKRWFSLIGIPLSPGQPGGVALLHVNLTSMLPPQIDTGLAQVETADKGRLRPKTDAEAVSGAGDRCPLRANSRHCSCDTKKEKAPLGERGQGKWL